MDIIFFAGLLGFLDDEDDLDHIYYYDDEDGAVSESNEMDEQIEDVEYITKDMVFVA